MAVDQEMLDAYAQTPMGVLSDRVSNVTSWTSDQQRVLNDLLARVANLESEVLRLSGVEPM